MIRLNKNKLPTYCFFGFWILVTLAKLLQISFIFYPAIAVGIFGMYLADDSYRTGFSLMLIPNIRMFDGLGNTFFVNIILFAPLVFKIIRERRIVTTALIHTLLLAVMELVHIIALQSYAFLIPNMVTVFTLLYVETILIDKNTSIDVPSVTRQFAFGSIYSAVVSFVIHSMNGHDMSIYFKGYGYRFTGYAADPNYFSVYMCLALAMLFIIRTHKKRDIAYIFALIAIELFTLSKMALVIMLLIVLYVSGKAVLNGFSHRTRFIKWFLMISIGLAAIFSERIANLLNITFSRLRQQNGSAITLDTITSSRSTLVAFYFETSLSDPMLPLVGYGLQYNDVFQETLSHNTYFDILLSWGLPGVVLFVAIIYTMISRLVSVCPERITFDHLLPLIVLGLMLFSLSCLSASMFWWIICAAMLPLKGLENATSDNIRYRSGI